MEASVGQVLAGKYRIERVLGRGGMGLVVAATHLQLGERVALKFLLPEALQNAEAVARFDREARAAVRIKSEYVARVSDVGTLDNGAPYMVMEYLDGVDLSTWLLQRGALPVEQAVEFLLQACEAIAEAHTLGIVHRDLKPANLFVIERPDGALAVKVLDFGISKTTGLGGSGADLTRTSAAMGSPLYMSPEQLHSAKDVDTRGDIWALGVVLYELLSGRPPFPGGTLAELVLKIVSTAPIPLSSVCAAAPPGLEAVLFKCLEKDRNARYRTVAELALALLEFAPRRSKLSVERIGRVMQRAGMSGGETQLVPSSDAVDATSVLPAPRTLASWGKTNPPANQRRRVVLIAAALTSVAIAALGTLVVLRSGAHGAALVSSALPLAAGSLPQPSAEVPAAGKSLPVVAPAPTLVDLPNSAPASAAAAASASSLPSPALLPAPPVAASKPATSPPHAAALRAPKPVLAASPTATPAAVEPTPAPLVSKPVVPPSGKNPLKMPIQ